MFRGSRGLVLAACLGGVLASAGGASAAPHTTAAVAIRYADSWNADRNPSKAEAYDAVFGNAASPGKVYSRASGGKVALRGIRNASGDAFGQWTLDMGTPLPVCDGITTLFEPSLTVIVTYLAGLAHGVDLSQYDKVVIVAPGPTSCGHSGIAEISGHNAIVNKKANPVQTAWVAAHEVGHTLGLRHAVAADCGAEPQFATGSHCTLVRYGDPYDLMGDGALNEQTPTQAYNLAAIGGIGAEAITSVPAGTRGTYRLIAPQSGATGTKLLMIRRSQPGAGNPSLQCDSPIAIFCEHGLDPAYLTAEFHNTAAGPAVVFHLTAAIAPDHPTVILKTDSGATLATTGASITDPATGARIVVKSVTNARADIQLQAPTARP